ncbi:MAG: Amidase enhancer [Calditrichaeota bacterium]|nr:Amidase enhancer [Calditrichota bacterium]
MHLAGRIITLTRSGARWLLFSILVMETLMASAKQPSEANTPPKDSVPAVAADEPVVAVEEPEVRVRLLERYDHVDFRVKGPFSIETLDGGEVFTSIASDLRWRCKVETSEPAEYVYTILVDTLETEQAAREVAGALARRGHSARILPLGRDIEIGGELVHQGRLWRVVLGAYDRESDARPTLDSLADIDSTWTPHILRHNVSDPEGTIELYDAEYDRSAMIELGFRITPDRADGEITVYDIRVGVGYHWEHTENRTYRGTVEVRIGNTGNLMAINELPLDEYLMGVIPSEMHYTYPIEALKAQAVAARSYTLAKLATRPVGDPDDFPASVAFQVYSGTTREHERTTRAVERTAGMVLKYGGQVCEAYFSSNSGGHTESRANWNPPGADYLVGIPVVPDSAANEFGFDLTAKDDVNVWIRSHPESYSNPRGTGIDILDRNARYFRWEVTYPRRELEEILKRKLGFDIGTLIAIHPVTRGVSGRITELELLGSHRNHTIRGELNIRRALSESTLYSSCFVVDTVMGDLGEPVELTLIGAGFGHGVGMDQTAAGVMAVKGMDFRQILTHFYRNAHIEKIW